MYNYAANQLTEMVPVSRIAQQLLNVVTNSKSTDIFVLNLSDLKPVPLTTAAVFDLIWNPAPWNATQDFNATARAWYSKFAQDYLQLATVDATTYALLWEAYFNVGYSEWRHANASAALNALLSSSLPMHQFPPLCSTAQSSMVRATTRLLLSSPASAATS